MPYTSNMLWSIWRSLELELRIYFLALSIASVYMLVSAVVIMTRLGSLRINRPLVDSDSLPHGILALQSRTEHLRQLLGAMSYLFAFIFFVSLRGAWMIVDNNRASTATLILNNLFFDFAFGANVCFVLLILHSVQWFVSSRVHAVAHRLRQA
jgi:hypothetical protein